MSHLLEQLEGRERRTECLRNDEAMQPCSHRYLTSYGNGWVCANRACGVGILSLAVPLPMPLVEEALHALGLSRAFFVECEAEARDVMRGKP